MNYSKEKLIWGILRLSMGWIFLWAFLDKLFGLGFNTSPEKAWINGASPTSGFLKFATKGPFAEFYQSLSGSGWLDWIFMLSLLFIGTTLILGILVKLGSYLGILWLIAFYTAGFLPPEHNPFLDDHIIYALIMIGLAVAGAGKWLGLGETWRNTNLVKKYSILE